MTSAPIGCHIGGSTIRPWDLYFCHRYDFRFPLIKHVSHNMNLMNLHAELDCCLFMQKTRQT